MNHICKKYTIRGIVQGVGFRPFVYMLAIKHALKGSVENTGSGVIVYAQGAARALDAFESALHSEAPPLSRIDGIDTQNVTCKAYTDFEIIESSLTCKSTAISPDSAICDDCLEELRNPKDRRNGYFLINCTNCGPRYSIIDTLPYDRPNTSMRDFEMCATCKEEYTNPAERRYHAQPISCHDCGPKMVIEGAKNLEQVAYCLKEGGIVALKGIGGFHLMCDATNENAVARLRERKNRPKKPLAVMFKDYAAAEKNVTCNALEQALLESKERPIVLVHQSAQSTIAKNVAPGIECLGVMLAYTPLHYLLFERFEGALVATSANVSDEPIYRSKTQIFEHLGGVADCVVDVEREIFNAVDDSLVQVTRGAIQMLRMGRGFAPLSLPLGFTPQGHFLRGACKQNILAVGAQQKNTMALAFGDTLILSPHIGDLSSVEAFEFFERTLKTFKRLYDFEPDLVVCDKHPDYMTSQWARAQNLPLLEIQHHHAHVLACMFEHALDETVLAFAFDGTGYGLDGTIWGGEVLVCEGADFERIGYLSPLRLLGGEKAVKEPRRVALSLLFECFEPDKMPELPLLKTFADGEIEVLYKAWQKGLNAPLTSSMGRLFDGVASLMDTLHVSTYEGQSGLMLEARCHNAKAAPFRFKIDEGVLDTPMIVRDIVDAIIAGKSAEVPDRFINTLVSVMDAYSAWYPKLPIVLGGGVFQNKTLLSRTLAHFESLKRRCYVQSHTPVNDGAIALGQVVYGLKFSI